MIKNKDIICISSIDWDFVWHHQEIMSIFASNGNRVLYVENTGLRAPKVRDIGRLKKRIINWRKGKKGIRKVSENLYVYSPMAVPLPYSKIAKFINKFLLVNRIKSWMKSIGSKDPIIWTFLPTLTTLNIIDNIEHSLVVYYNLAEFTALVSSPEVVNRTEKELLKRTDVVFAQNEKIKERCQDHHDNIHIFTFGVKSDIFLKPSREISQPEDIKNIKGPIFGYVGSIHKHIDFNLLRKLSLDSPDSSVVLVGPVQAEVEDELKGLDNVYFLGKKEHFELPAYIDSFDVCLIPYLITDFTKTVFPTKLNEYLMRGKKVLSTPLPDVIKFVKNFGDVAFISENDERFVNKAKEIAKIPEDDAFREKAVEVAKENSWEKIIEQMSDIMEEAMK